MFTPLKNPPIVDTILSGLVPAKGKVFRVQAVLMPFAIFSIYSMIIPVAFLDLSITLYQWIYFSVMGIPKIKKSEFVVLERWDFSKLTGWQKFNCVYCEYINGILAFAKAVGVQTELYSCAIRHNHALKGREHENEYRSAKVFE